MIAITATASTPTGRASLDDDQGACPFERVETRQGSLRLPELRERFAYGAVLLRAEAAPEDALDIGTMLAHRRHKDLLA